MSRSLAELDKYKVLHLDFENDFEDSSGNNNNGTPTDVEWKPTSRGMKPSFNGSSSFIDCGNGIELNMGSNDFTLSAWINPKVIANDGVFDRIITKKNGTTEGGYALTLTDLGAFSFAYGTSVSHGVKTTTTFNTNQWYHVIGVRSGSSLYIYVDGVLQTTVQNAHGMAAVDNCFIGSRNGDAGTFIDGDIDDGRFYKGVGVDATEALALYNSTKQGHGVLWHERSHTHRLSPQVEKSTVFATDMRTKDASRKLIDLSGNNNHGTVTGAVRSGGYFSDGMRFDGVDDYVDSDGTVNPDKNYSYGVVVKSLSDAQSANSAIIRSNNDAYGFLRSAANSYDARITATGSIQYGSIPVTLTLGKYYVLDVVVLDGTFEFYVNGVLFDTVSYDGTAKINSQLYIGWEGGPARFFNGEIGGVYLHDSALSASTIKSRFNSLAVLPLYHIDFSRYPSNTTVYDSNIPYSSMRVESGSFKIDGSQLVCVTDGIIKMRNAHDFDGSEYISITADGVKTSDTGSVTVGTMTASITQGSNQISIEMDAADVLDDMLITFRKPVE